MDKQAVYKSCLALLDEKIQRCIDSMSDAQDSANSDTKSSAGDKHETSRAMAMLEKEKLAQQLSEFGKMKEVLTRIDATKRSDFIGLGSLVYTSMGVFFISIALGKITVLGQPVFCISKSSPMGSHLLNKKVGESFVLNQNKITIEKVL